MTTPVFRRASRGGAGADSRADRVEAILDPSQRAVVELGDGVSASVIGAPGSGKTTTLVELIADRVRRRGWAPEEVLAITQSRPAATALRDRLALRLGDGSTDPAVRTSNGPIARTANSIAFEIVAAAGSSERPPVLLTGGEQDRIIADLLAGEIDDELDDYWPAQLSRDVRGLRGFRSELRELMMRCTEYGIDVHRLAELASRLHIPEWAAVARFVPVYTDAEDLAHADAYDSAELSAFAARILEDDERGAAALGTLARLKLIVVDDVQDVTQSTVNILSAFARRGVTVIALGDPDVASLTFRGARIDALRDLGAALGIGVSAKLTLGTVYRGRPEIRALIDRTVARIGTAGVQGHRDARLVASQCAESSDAPSPVVRVEGASRARESTAIARLLREHHLLGGIPWSRMAVATRSGAALSGLQRALSVGEVPVRTTAARRVVRDEVAAAHLLRAASVATGRERLTAGTALMLVSGPLAAIDPVALRRLRLALRREELDGGGSRSGDELIAEALAHPGGFATLDTASARRAERLARALFAGAERASAHSSIEEILWAIWDGCGVATAWRSDSEQGGVVGDEANRSLDAVVALFAAARRYVERAPYDPPSGFLEEQLGAELPEDTLAPDTRDDAVLVATAPALVAQEFDVVVVSGLQDGVWPDLRPRGSLLRSDRLVEADQTGALAELDARSLVRSDELRMFALTVSRARTQVVLSCTSNDDEQPSTLFGLAADAPLEDVHPPLSLRSLVGRMRHEAVRTGDPAAVAALARLASENVPGAHPSTWYGTLEPSTAQPLVDLDADDARVTISPSSLAKLVETPLGWFIDRMAAQPAGIASSVGTIVHGAFEQAGRSDTGMDAEELWPLVAARWSEMRFEAPWIQQRETDKAIRLVEGVADYLADRADENVEAVAVEAPFTVDVPPVRINGTIDRIERTADGLVIIVDLKTGATMPAQGEMPRHPQLSAYQLALESGAITTSDAADRRGGARLVFVANSAGGRRYATRSQQPRDADERDGFARSVVSAGETAAAATFAAPADAHEGRIYGAYRYRLHLIRAVTA